MSAWPIMPISDLTETSQYGTSAKAGSEGAYPILRMGNITREGHLDLSDLKYIDFSPSEAARYTTKPGDLLFNRTNSAELVGKTAVVRDEKPYAFAGYLVRIRTNSLADPHYVSAYLNSTLGKRKLRSMAKSIVGMANINARELGSIRIPVPPLDEQRRIAAILDQADVLRRKRRESLVVLKKLRASIFEEQFGSPITDDRKWGKNKLRNLTAKIGSGATPRGGDVSYKKSGIPLIRSMNVHDFEFKSKGLAFIDDHQAYLLNGATVRSGDILFNITGASVARICRVPEDLDGSRVNQHVAIIRPNSSISNYFLESTLAHPAVKTKLLRIGEAGATRQAITKAEIEEFEVIVPPLPVQHQFELRMRELDCMFGQIKAHLAQLDALFASLQHRAFRGEL